ncbi:bifunctional phosphoribosyl-AMP cyclohydrolase/phosphoribosyl-ATP diphosphatase HisIE [Candidatus Peregrinibacteria bacterium]|jgi:phosphoribosyl-AMP cyclohydrolase / phosphoribosyl-ATP pyrophosphohydrolase|nr:bifunctional phosphoribosyl-AMP cyclohydrolase/phosphoribosyl-ATP diphosphatase HisIE [Candidatus Peregrinibacteria bacterium]MBT7736495.1 bifunctional phosphoribosyl-AMP cyclohydrolase/phosphoribosyl-ATP diphosphatase HisIE [Candidatus Peregrinibacteria bacterium]
MKLDIKKLDFEKMNGLLPVIVQDSCDNTVLMLGFMNLEALEKTIEDKKVTFFSRTKERLWQKGESSGNFLEVEEILSDCDEDSLLIMAKPVGPTCHTGEKSCFGAEGDFLRRLFSLIAERKSKMPEGSYTTSLFDAGLDRILEKIDEESAEVVVAAKSEGRQRLIEESCDLIYHMYVLLAEEGICLDDLEEELRKRNK